LAGVYSRHRTLSASPQQVLAHERVVEAVMANGTVLPLRFGTRLDNEQALIAAITARHGDLISAIHRVRGHVEMGLRVIPRSPAGPGAPPRHSPKSDRDSEERARDVGGRGGERPTGRAYLLERLAEHRLAERSRREIQLPLTKLAKAHVLSSRISPPAILVASYLVCADEVKEFRARAAALADRVPEVQAFVTGPWPPYSFVDSRAPGSSSGSERPQ
jgi:hypothetical protein